MADPTRTHTVRAATAADTSSLIDAQLALAWETESLRLDRETVERGVARVLEAAVGAEYRVVDAPEGSATEDSDRSPVGCLMLTREWSDWRNGDYLWVQSVYVAPHARRLGIATAMFRDALDRAAGDDATAGVRLYVEHGNESAMAVYRSLGFVPSGHAIYERLFA